MKHGRILTELFEETAAEAAKKAGLETAGFGRWKDKSGKVVAKTVDGKLAKVEPTEKQKAEQSRKAKNAEVDKQIKDAQAPSQKVGVDDSSSKDEIKNHAKDFISKNVKDQKSMSRDEYWKVRTYFNDMYETLKRKVGSKDERTKAAYSAFASWDGKSKYINKDKSEKSESNMNRINYREIVESLLTEEKETWSKYPKALYARACLAAMNAEEDDDASIKEYVKGFSNDTIHQLALKDVKKVEDFLKASNIDDKKMKSLLNQYIEDGEVPSALRKISSAFDVIAE